MNEKEMVLSLWALIDIQASRIQLLAQSTMCDEDVILDSLKDRAETILQLVEVIRRVKDDV